MSVQIQEQLGRTDDKPVSPILHSRLNPRTLATILSASVVVVGLAGALLAIRIHYSPGPGLTLALAGSLGLVSLRAPGFAGTKPPDRVLLPDRTADALLTVVAAGYPALIVISVLLAAHAGARSWTLTWLSLVPTVATGAVVLSMRRIHLHRRRSLLLVLCLLPAALLTLIVVFALPVIGSDEWFLSWFAARIRDSSSFPAASGGTYSRFPLAPAAIAAISSLTGLSTAVCLQITIPLALLGAPIAVYGLSRQVVGERAALLAVLLASTSMWPLYWLQFAVPFALGLVYWLLFALAFASWPLAPKRAVLAPTIALLFFIIFIHPITTLATLILTGGLILSGLVARLLLERQTHLIVLSRTGFAIFGAVTYSAYLLYLAPNLLVSRVQAVSYDVHSTRVVAAATTKFPALAYELNNGGFYMLLGLGVLATVVWLAEGSTALRILIPLTAVAYTAIAYGGWALHLLSFLPHRWLAFATYLFVIPAARQMCRWAGGKRLAITRLALLILFLGAYTGMNLISTNVSPDAPLYAADVTVRLGLTRSELAASELAVAPSGFVFTDSLMAPAIWYQPHGRLLPIPLTNELLGEKPLNSVLYLVRTRAFYGAVQGRDYRLDPNLLHKFVSQRINRTLDSGDTAGYVVPSRQLGPKAVGPYVRGE